MLCAGSRLRRPGRPLPTRRVLPTTVSRASVRLADLAFAMPCDSRARAEYTSTRPVDAYRDQSARGVHVYWTVCASSCTQPNVETARRRCRPFGRAIFGPPRPVGTSHQDLASQIHHVRGQPWVDSHEVDHQRRGRRACGPPREDAGAVSIARRAGNARNEVWLRSRLLRGLHGPT